MDDEVVGAMEVVGCLVPGEEFAVGDEEEGEGEGELEEEEGGADEGGAEEEGSLLWWLLGSFICVICWTCWAWCVCHCNRELLERASR